MTVPATTADGPRFSVILGRCDDMRAEVYVRATGLTPGGAVTLSGTLSGPESRIAITLPVTASLVDLGPAADGTSAVARAILTEPSYWSPELPNRYRLRARLARGAETIADHECMAGLRRLGVRGRSFWLEGRRWVPRGVACDAASCAPQPLRDMLAAAVIDDPAEATCAAADEAGVGIVGRCTADLLAALERWSDHPSVMLAVLPRGSDTAGIIDRIKPFKGTMLVGIEVDAASPPGDVPVGIDFVVVTMAESATPHAAWRDGTPPLPLVAARPASGGLAERRRSCDRLQADLAAWRDDTAGAWDWAGYLVT